MRQAQTYKPSNTFSFGGFILMFISMLVAGALLSWLYVVLQAVIPIIYLCILITIGFGAAIGGIGALFVKVYKIRHPGLAIASTLIAMLFVYLFHWCVYVSRDYDKNVFDNLKSHPACEYYLGMSESQMQQYNFYEDPSELVTYYKSTLVKSSGKFSLSSKEYDALSAKQKKHYDENSSIWDFMNLDEIIGKTDAEIKESVKNMKGKNAYSFKYEYRKIPAHTIGYLLVHPGDLWDDIRTINGQGRWSMSSRHSYSSTSSKEPVTGIILWITWLGEMLLMFAPALAIVYARAGSPFIEQDNDWAITDKGQPVFKFVDPYPGNNSGEKQFKSVFMSDIDSLFSLQPLMPQMGVLNTFYTVSYCHSKFYTENYLTITHTKVTNAKNNQRAVTNVAKKVLVDADYIASLHGLFGYPVPSNCAGVNRFAQQTAQEQPKQDQYQDQQAYQQYSQPQQDQYQNQQAYQQYSQPQQEQYQNQQAYQQYSQSQQEQYQNQQAYQQQEYDNSGDMDGIDTSNIDLSSLDNMNQ